MEKRADIFYRLARFWAGAPPDWTTMLLAALEHPEVLADAVVFVLDAYAGNIATALITTVFVLYVWPRVPSRIKTALRRARRQIPSSPTGPHDSTAGTEQSPNHRQRHPHW